MIVQFIFPDGSSCHKLMDALPSINDRIQHNEAFFKVKNTPTHWIENPYKEHLHENTEHTSEHKELIPQIQLQLS